MPGRGAYGRGALSTDDKRRLQSANVFSDSSLSHDSSSIASEPVPQQRPNPTKKAQSQRARPQRSNTNALADISNISEKKAPRKKRAKPKPHIPVENIPNFDSFDDYNLVVQPVTPIKTHVSQSTTSHSYNWEHYPPAGSESTQHSLGLLSPVASSPHPNAKQSSQPLHLESIGSHSESIDRSGVVTRSMTNQPTRPSATEMRTKRQRRLQHVMGDSYCMETSTPDHVGRKRTRLHEPLASPVRQPEEDLIMSMEQMSLHNSLHESLHDSLRASPCKQSGIPESPSSNQVTASSRVLQVLCKKIDLADDSSLAYRSPQSRNISNSLTQSLSIFSHLSEESNYTTCSSNAPANSTGVGVYSQLEDVEEEEEADVESDSENGVDGLKQLELYLVENQHEGISEQDAVFEQCENESADEAVPGFFQPASPTLSELVEGRRHRLLNRECGQLNSLDWYEFMDSRKLSSMSKIGEGVYGEVFLYEDDDSCKIIKVMPFGGDCTVNDEPQRKTKEVHSEVKVSRMLSQLGCNFIKANRFSVVKGQYPKELLQLWDDYSEDKVSENDRPDYFPVDQRYIVFDFSHGGECLETYKFSNAAEALSLLLQVGWSLAVAETACEFEHRDLHWGNILLASTCDTSIMYSFTGMQELYEVKCEGVRANIIDFTLSRLRADRDEVLFCDLSKDETLFQGYGDYQFDIYRQMKDVTRYLVEKLAKAKAIPSQRGISPSPAQFKRMLIDFHQRSESYYSAVQMVFTDDMFTKYVTVHNAQEDSDD